MAPMNDGEIQSWRDACPPRNPLPTSSLHATAQGQEMNDNLPPEGSAGTESTASGVCRVRCDSDTMKSQKQRTIFVSIASLRDSECQHTVRGRMTVVLVCGKQTCSVSRNWRAQSNMSPNGFPPRFRSSRSQPRFDNQSRSYVHFPLCVLFVICARYETSSPKQNIQNPCLSASACRYDSSSVLYMCCTLRESERESEREREREREKEREKEKKREREQIKQVR